jgi:hypothetical protein
MDLFMDLNVLAVGGFQWTALERRVEENFPYNDDLQHSMAVHGIPRIDTVERVMGIEPTSSAWEAEVLPLNYTRNTDAAHRFYNHELPRAMLIGVLDAGGQFSGLRIS